MPQCGATVQIAGLSRRCSRQASCLSDSGLCTQHLETSEDKVRRVRLRAEVIAQRKAAAEALETANRELLRACAAVPVGELPLPIQVAVAKVQKARREVRAANADK